MGSDTQILTLKEEDLRPKDPVLIKDKEPIDIELAKAFRTSNIGIVGDKMPAQTRILILNVLEKGISLDTAARYAMVSPRSLKAYIDSGLDEASSYTQEKMDAGVVLSDKATFAVECMQRMAQATVNMGMEFYDRCFETGNTHLMMWWLERLDQEKYHLKKKVEAETNVDISGKAVVEFKFTAPESLRSPEDNALYEGRLKQLNDKYKGDE